MKQTEETLCTFINTWHARGDSSCLPAEKGQHRSRQGTKASSRLVCVLGRLLRSGVLDQDLYLGAEGIYKGKKKKCQE